MPVRLDIGKGVNLILCGSGETMFALGDVDVLRRGWVNSPPHFVQDLIFPIHTHLASRKVQDDGSHKPSASNGGNHWTASTQRGETAGAELAGA
jgi:hypothetical protein